MHIKKKVCMIDKDKIKVLLLYCSSVVFYSILGHFLNSLYKNSLVKTIKIRTEFLFLDILFFIFAMMRLRRKRKAYCCILRQQTKALFLDEIIYIFFLYNIKKLNDKKISCAKYWFSIIYMV